MVWIRFVTIKNWKSVLLDFLFRHRTDIGGAFSVQKSMLCIWSDGSLITYITCLLVQEKLRALFKWVTYVLCGAYRENFTAA